MVSTSVRRTSNAASRQPPKNTEDDRTQNPLAHMRTVRGFICSVSTSGYDVHIGLVCLVRYARYGCVVDGGCEQRAISVANE